LAAKKTAKKLGTKKKAAKKRPGEIKLGGVKKAR
jgi:hypothetical protein